VLIAARVARYHRAMVSANPPPAEAADSGRGRERVERWTQALLDGCLDDIVTAFAADDTDAPVVVWNPVGAEMRSEMLRFLLEHWRALAGGQAMPSVSALDPQALRPVLGYVLLVDPINGGADFRYRLYGSLVASVSGRDMTGKRVSEHHASPHVVDFSLAGYRAVYRRPAPLYTLRHPARALYTRAWERLVLPLVDATGGVGRLLVGNVPTDYAGAAIRPQY
jgi:hypothetical protein